MKKIWMQSTCEKESLSLHITLCSSHPPNADNAMMCSLIGNHYLCRSNNDDYSMKENKLINDWVNRGYESEKLINMFKEAESKIKNKELEHKYSKIGKRSLEEVLKCIKLK